jgi:hypothetical protein
LFKRGDVWNESLTPPSSGSSGNPIKFDAYGTGAAPNLTGYYAVPSTTWVRVTGNAWKAPVPSTFSTINFCLFGSVWGQKVSAVSSNLTEQGNFYLANGYIYVYSQGNPASFYNEPIVPMALSDVPVINVSGQSWLTFQHFLINWFDQYGVYVQGESDHLVFANMEVDSMIPEGTQPLGFYVDESAPGPSDIKIYNTEAHLNYDGYRFDGTATAISMVNDKAYASRDGALVDNTGAVTYSYCHFYASSLAVADSTDVEYTSGTGPIAGAGNIAVDTAPAVQVYKRYPAEVTLTVDDSGMTAGADTYYATQVLPVADAAGVPVGAAITVGYPLANTLISEFQGWINAGRDVTSHSMSHTYYTNTDALDIQYTGSGTAATLSISDRVLTIAVTGASDSVSYNLAQGQPQGTILGLKQALLATGKFTVSYFTPCQGPYGTGCSAYTGQALLAQDLADVSGQDVETEVYHLELDVTRLTTDEITLSRQWMTANLTGLPATPVYVYPGGYETTTMQGITEGVPYGGARGALKEDLGVKDTYADGFNAQNITSFGVNPSWMGAAGVTPAILNQKIQALVWKESVWGAPWGIFWHLNELVQNDPVGGTEITNFINDFKNSGATIRTNTGLVNWLLSGEQETGTDGNDYYTFPATSMTLDFRPTKNSPVVDAGQNLGTAYELDINGVNQNSYGSGWEIGAHVYQGYSAYGGEGGGSHFTVGLGDSGQEALCAFAAGALGGIEATCANPNLRTPTVMCVTLDSSTPSSNGVGTGCSNGFALSPVASGGTEYPGYFNFNRSSAVKVITEVAGQSDSFAAYYNETVPPQTINADNFGMQCGPGEATDCPIVSGVVTWPDSIATPKVFRIHDSGQGWSSIEPSCAAYTGSLCVSPNYNWTDMNAELDAIADHGEMGMVQMLSPPCWTQVSCNVADLVYPNGGTAPPTDLGTGPMGSSPNFNAFITTWVSHVSPNGNSVANNIKIFQLWNEWDLCQHWTGTAAQLYALLAYPVQILRANIPGVVITTPSEQYEGTNCQTNYSADLATWLNLENTNGRISDVVDWHGYLTLTNATTNLPETQWAAYQSNYVSVQAEIAGWNSAPFLNSETNFNAGNGYVCPTSQYTEADCAGQVVRWQILHDSNGGVGLDWYYWNTTIGQTPGSTASGYFGFSNSYYYAQQYLIGGHFTTAAALASGTTWTAPFIESNGAIGLWVWSTSESGASFSVPSGYTDYRDLDGGLTAVTSGESLPISTMPILLEQAALVTVNVYGSGAVTSSPLGISCPGSCSAAFSLGSLVTLTVTASSGYVFSPGWSSSTGPCAGSITCSFTLTANTSLTASFAKTPVTIPNNVEVLAAPSVGGLTNTGDAVTDPMISGNNLFRVTDGTTQTGSNQYFEYSVPFGGSADNNIISLVWPSGSYGIALNDSGGSVFLRQANPSTSNSTALCAGWSGQNKGNLTANAGEWSYNNAYVYIDHGTQAVPQITALNVQPCIVTPSAGPTSTELANILPVITTAGGGATAATWQSLGGMNRLDNVNSDSFLTIDGFSTTAGQDTGCLVVASTMNAVMATPAAATFTVWNTCTGDVSTYNATGSQTSDLGLAAIPDTRGIHNTKYHGGTGGAGYGWATITGHIDTGSGTVNTSGTEVTWDSGTTFKAWWAGAGPISINGVEYTIASVASTTSLTLTTSAGTQTGVSYSWTNVVGTDSGYYFWNIGTNDVRGCVKCSGHETELQNYFIGSCGSNTEQYNFCQVPYALVGAGFYSANDTNTITWLSGNPMQAGWASSEGGLGTVELNGNVYTVSSCTSTACTLTTNVPTTSSAVFNYPAGSGGVWATELVANPSLWDMPLCSEGYWPYTSGTYTVPCAVFPNDDHYDSNSVNPTNDQGSIKYATTTYSGNTFPRDWGMVSTSGNTVTRLYGLSAAITNCSETSGSIVTLTAKQSFTSGVGLAFSGLTGCTWLNGVAGMTVETETATTFTFLDTTGHGTYSSASDTGSATAQFTSFMVGHNIILGSNTCGQLECNFTVTGFTSGTQITVNPAPGTIASANYYYTLYPGGSFDEIQAALTLNTPTLAPCTGFGCNYRLAYEYNTTQSYYFNTEEAITSCSQDGKLCLMSTDWQGQLGLTSGTAGPGYIASDWPGPSFTVTAGVGSYFQPQVGNTGDYVYEITSCSGACTTGITEPATWNQTAGGTQIDGTITYTNEGRVRGDVMAIEIGFGSAF